MMTISFILVLELSGKKKRGLFIGLVNTGFTTGVSLGAVIAGALLPITGWVRFLHESCGYLLILLQRPLFGAQGPLALIFGIGIYFSIPKSFTSGQKGAGEGSITTNLARIDYLGAVTLVSVPFPSLVSLQKAANGLRLPQSSASSSASHSQKFSGSRSPSQESSYPSLSSSSSKYHLSPSSQLQS